MIKLLAALHVLADHTKGGDECCIDTWLDGQSPLASLRRCLGLPVVCFDEGGRELKNMEGTAGRGF